ncbi:MULTISPECIES: aminoglycoside phosphotransferase family protein [Arthrobacter]|uniref:Aminoglycoside phosphotransferase family protein n=1 Tax=Arthrobacter sunyaminii TaxID=2816859 RepID=A0A975S5S4_9MICC|nr:MULTISPECIES: aminoglycoside phosphotransferase family protein [Arthrobacter]MBO0897010.1 aminoglycoside phosphotransferase family protein [Arthrobacter sunyaminii]MBO0909494.1 aminoglycoside phosphotransferase family protein [Arthrobacter sunyaminii]QWQ36194.1 aminoglycoside phosphotransferase family protein [Arthrobacter sunyaminii]
MAVLGEAAVVRVVYGPRHVQSTEGEAGNLAAFTHTGLPFLIPAVLRTPFHGSGWSAQLNSYVPGDHRPLEAWTAVREPLARILAALADVIPRSGGSLRPVREWCGAGEWPAIVAGITVALPGREAKAAGRVVADVLAAEEMVIPAVVHGDLGLHNVLWNGPGVSGLVDFDNACLGDPAMDLAPLIGAFGAAAVTDIADPDLVSRAQLHRASLSLQVAAAAELAGDGELRDFALGNFSDRFSNGTLYDPGPRRTV